MSGCCVVDTSQGMEKGETLLVTPKLWFLMQFILVLSSARFPLIVTEKHTEEETMCRG